MDSDKRTDWESDINPVHGWEWGWGKKAPPP